MVAVFESSEAAEKYAKWRLPIMPNAVVSSRDALHAALCRSAAVSGADRARLSWGGGHTVTRTRCFAYGKTEDFWHKADAFALLGVIDWTDQDQAVLRPR